MKIAMLWFDSSKDEFTLKLNRAAEYYFKKYDKHPNTCLVHPSSFDPKKKELKIGEITVRPLKSVLLNHIWIGIEEKETQ